MRITRDFLLKLARQAADQRAHTNRNLVCIYLTGSLLGENPLLGGTTDIDLVIVHPDDPPVHREIIPLSDEVHVDMLHYSQAFFNQPRRLRSDAWMAPTLYSKPVVMHDTQHWFEFTQASACAQMNRPEYVLARSRPQAEAARQIWMELNGGMYAPGTGRWMRFFFSALENAANAIAGLSGPPLTERRFFMHLPERAAAIERPGMASGLVDLFYDQEIDEDTFQGWLETCNAEMNSATRMFGVAPEVHPGRRAYVLRAAAALQADYPAAAFWLLLRNWNMAAEALEDEAPGWQEAIRRLGLDETHAHERLEALDAYLDILEETLEWWAEQNGLDTPEPSE